VNAVQECCPRFDPAPWQERFVALDGKKFVKARVRSFLRIPLNYGGVAARNLDAIRCANAEKPGMLMLSDENSWWGSDLYLEVQKDVPGVRMATLAGTFLAQAYEGSYRTIPVWIADLKRRLAAKGKSLKGLLFFYTTCPMCAQKYGQNYVVLFGQT